MRVCDIWDLVEGVVGNPAKSVVVWDRKRNATERDGSREDSTHMSRIESLEIETDMNSMYMSVPLLEDDSLYRVWLNLVIRHFFLRENTPFTVFQTSKFTYPLGNILYRSKDCIEYAHPDGKIIEHWGPGGGVVLLREEKQITVLKDRKRSILDKVITCEADLYEHPGNESIHALDILFPTPSTAYVGKNVYFDPGFDERILINIHDTWVWVMKDSIVRNTPEYLRDEINFLGSVL